MANIVFITGASSGIGEACARRFAKAGYHLILCARRTNLIHALAKELTETYQIKVYGFELDVREYKQVQEKISALPDEWKQVDILINNAGLSRGLDKLYEGNPDDWDQMIDTNIKGLLYVTREVLPQMVARKSGHIINLGSIAGREVYPGGGVYCATKFAVAAITRTLRMELLGTNVRVTNIEPGAVKTEFSIVRFNGNIERAEQVYEGIHPLTPDNIAETIFFCISSPSHLNINDILITPTDQASATMFYRE